MTTKVNKELLKGSLAILILAILSEEPTYGYRIVKELKTRSRDVFSLGEGTLYPLLHKLQSDGLLESYWQEVDGRRRKYYALTKNGRRALDAKTDEWRLFAKAMNQVTR